MIFTTPTRTLIDYAKSEGVGTLEGEVLAENATMLCMCAEFGFVIAASPSDPSIRVVTLTLDRN